MADQIIAASLQLNSQQANESVKSFKQQLKEAQADLIGVADKFGLSSKEAAAAAQRVAELKDQMGDAKTLVDAFNPDRKFQAFGIAVKGVTNGFTALQGAMGLVGAESEDLQKTLVKVQSALALSEGVNGLMEMKDTFKIVQNVGVQAFQKIKAAIGSTGIGLFLIAIGSLVAYWDDIKEAISGVSDEQVKLNEQAQENLKAAKEKSDALSVQENSLRLQGKSEREILQIKIAAKKEQIDAAIIALRSAEDLRKSQIEAAQRNRDILKGALEFVGGGINLLLKGVDAVGKVFGKNWGLSGKLNDWIADQFFDVEETKKKGQESVDAAKKTLDELISQRDGFQLSIREIDKKAADERLKQREEEWQKYKEQIQKEVDEELALRAERKQKAMENEIADMQDRQRIAEDEKKQEDERNDRRTAALSKWLENYVGAAQVEMQVAETKRKHQEDQAVAYEGLLNNAADILGRQTAAGKTMAIAAATIDTYQAANSALKANYGIFGPLAQVARFVAVAATVKRGLDNVKQIASVKVPGGAGGAAPSLGSLPSVSVSAPLTPQQTTTSLDPNSIQQIGNAAAQGVNRVFVLDADIANNREREARLTRAARIAG